MRLCVLFLPPDYAMVGLSRGGQQVGKCKEVFGKAVQLLVELASLQVSTAYCMEKEVIHVATCLPL